MITEEAFTEWIENCDELVEYTKSLDQAQLASADANSMPVIAKGLATLLEDDMVHSFVDWIKNGEEEEDDEEDDDEDGEEDDDE